MCHSQTRIRHSQAWIRHSQILNRHSQISIPHSRIESNIHMEVRVIPKSKPVIPKSGSPDSPNPLREYPWRNSQNRRFLTARRSGRVTSRSIQGSKARNVVYRSPHRSTSPFQSANVQNGESWCAHLAMRDARCAYREHQNHYHPYRNKVRSRIR